MFSVGDRVSYTDNKRRRVTGKVTKVINHSQVIVKLDKYYNHFTREENDNGMICHILFLKLIEKAVTPEVKSDKFWMVVGNGPAFVRHTSKESADTEAERLAKANPGVEFFVVEAVSSVNAVGVVKRAL